MALFLNTKKLNYWIPKIIKEAKKELILVVPYIQISDTIFKSLKVADRNKVEIILIYRENKLSEKEKEKLLNLNNISLLHHPNIHCKSYFNGELLVVSSMNLYDFSEKNNREMGVLFSRHYIENEKENIFNYEDNEDVFIDSILEIRDIIRSSNVELATNKVKTSSFEIDIIKTDEEIEIQRCNLINSHFLNKKFKPFEEEEHVWFSICRNFFDNIDVIFEHHRLAIRFNLNEKELKDLYKQWMKTYKEYEFKGFKYYWNYYASDLLIYKDRKFDWDELEKKPKLYYKKTNEGINNIINKYRKITGK